MNGNFYFLFLQNVNFDVKMKNRGQGLDDADVVVNAVGAINNILKNRLYFFLLQIL